MAKEILYLWSDFYIAPNLYPEIEVNVMVTQSSIYYKMAAKSQQARPNFRQ